MIAAVVGLAVGPASRAAAWAAEGQVASPAAGPPKAEAPPSPDPRNLEGVWFKKATIDDPVARAKTGDSIERPPLPPMTPKALAMVNAREAARKAGHPLPDPELKCAPSGEPLTMFLPYPFQIIQTPGQVTIVAEHDRANQIIFMDRPQPKRRPPATFLGHAVGHWQGDTLVVDIIAERPENTMYPFLPMSENTHVVERFHKVDGGKKLVMDWTIEDPTLYPKPFSGSWEFLWWPRTRVMEYVCEEADHPEDAQAAGFHQPAYYQGAK